MGMVTSASCFAHISDSLHTFFLKHSLVLFFWFSLQCAQPWLSSSLCAVWPWSSSCVCVCVSASPSSALTVSLWFVSPHLLQCAARKRHEPSSPVVFVAAGFSEFNFPEVFKMVKLGKYVGSIDEKEYNPTYVFRFPAAEENMGEGQWKHLHLEPFPYISAEDRVCSGKLSKGPE